MHSKNWNLLLLSCVFMLGCSKKVDESKATRPATPVTVAQSETHAVELLEESVGTLESFDDPIVSAEIPAKVLEIHAVAGGAIKKGQLLAVLDAQDVNLSRKAAQAELHRVGILINNQTKSLMRLEQLRAQNFISQAALDDAVAQSKTLRNQVRAAQAQLALADRMVSKTQVYSPVSGRVESQIAVPGQYVKVGDPMFKVVALNKLRVRLPFPEKFSAQLQRGMTVKVSGPADHLVLTGDIVEIRPMAETNNRSFDVFVTLDNPGDWKPGSSVIAKVVLGEHLNAVVVPEKSVVFRPAGKVVYVVKGDMVEQRIVQVGVEQNGMLEILNGLQANETVVVDGAGFLTDKTKVAVRNIGKPVVVNATSAVMATQ